MAYDIEDLLDDIGSIISDNFNDKVSEVNVEKGDSVLIPVDDNAIFKQTLRLQTVAYDPYVFYGIVDIANVGEGVVPCSAMKVITHIGVVLRDTGADNLVVSKMLRYHRVLKEIFEDNWVLIENSIKLNVSNLSPVEFTRLGDENNYRVMGIQIETILS